MTKDIDSMVKDVDEMTAEELLGKLQEAYERQLEKNEIQPGVFTTNEISIMTGWGSRKSLTFVKQLMADGEAAPVFATRKDAWGRIQPNIPAIRLIME